MIKYEHIEYFEFLWILLPLIILFVWYIYWRKKSISKFATAPLFEKLAPLQSATKHYVKFVLIVFAIVLLIIGLTNPKVGTQFEKVKREGVDVMIAIDVSRSMNAEDVQPSRMLKARQFVSNLMNKMSNNRIGLIVFAGNAYLQMPLTVDYSATKMYLKQINTDLVPTQGTAIGDAIELAQKSYPENKKNQKVLLLISDGENHEGNAKDAIESAKKNGIKIITIGVGSEKGGPIPLGRNGEFKKDLEGNIVVSKLNKSMLKDLAKEANGTYYDINTDKIVKNIINEIGSIDGVVIEEKVITDYKKHFQLFLFIAIILLIIEFMISYRKTFNFKLFK